MKSELNKITDQIKKTKNINEETKYARKTFNAIDLLTPERIDLVAKIKFLDYLEGKDCSDFVKNLYEAHLEAFNGGKNCSEAGDDMKNNFDDYVESFKKTAQSIKNDNFNPELSLVPVGNSNVILDGAHRVASAIYYGKTIEGIVFRDIKENYNYHFFENNLLDENYLDYMVLEYCKLKPNTFVFCIWPRADKGKRDKAYSLIRKKTSVIYEKEIDLNFLGYRNFVIQVYRDFSNWIGNSENHYKGANSQLDSCYFPGVPLKIFVVEADSRKTVVDIKKEVREIFGIGNFSVHSTDNQQETIYMLNLLLNKNSIDLMNNGKPDCYVGLEKSINRIRNKVLAHDINSDDFILVSSAVLGLYSLREPGDIDYISKSDIRTFLDNDNCENNNQYIELYGKTVDELLYNPKNYLFYNGVKFITLETLVQYKKNRGRKKDLNDIELIEQFRKNNHKTIRVYSKKISESYHRSLRKTRIMAINALKTLHLYDFVYNIVKGRPNEQ